MWLVSTNLAKLKHFLSGGTKVELLDQPVDDSGKQKEEGKEGEGEGAVFEVGAGDEKEESRASLAKPGTGANTPKLPNDALPDAERYIPPAWKTVDRVLDVVFWVSSKSQKNRNQKKQNRKKNMRKQVVITEDEDEDEDKDEDEEEAERRKVIFENGELSSLDNTETAEQWEQRTGEMVSMEQIESVVWVFTKWDDLGYDEGLYPLLFAFRVSILTITSIQLHGTLRLERVKKVTTHLSVRLIDMSSPGPWRYQNSVQHTLKSSIIELRMSTERNMCSRMQRICN
jgi:hypothetical protein